ncbi:MAG: PD-(D/E)XK nuclease family protein, partial [Bacilli bacterium]|nr:PD-(D/E)XK nuclease family protein [Bacilli bacterium]
THAYNEFLWRGGELYDYDKELVIKEFGYDVIAPVWEKLKYICESFYKKFKDKLIPLGLEQIVGSRDYDVAGSIDFLAYSKKLDAIIIIDYKTNKEIKFKSYKDQKMLYPLNNVPDCNYYHYCLQLATYKCILEHETNLKIYNKKWLVWMNEINNDFVLYECEDLDKEAKLILEARRR